ncbi:MAG: isochorismatase family protein [Pseudoalteromonas sp.]
MINELAPYSDVIKEVPGKRGLNAFTNTNLNNLLVENNITSIVLAGTVTSICIDSTGRSGVELDSDVTVLSDCTSSRTPFEQEFYCNEVFPLYATVCLSEQLLN